jgi:ribosomal protein S18 acetylase RimI-like enzyme
MAVVIRRMKVEDIVDAKGVDLLCWTDLRERFYGIRERLAPRTDENMLTFLHSDPDGAFVASDECAGIIGSCFSHVWGATGWVGPLSVLPSYQARGLGKDLLKRSLRYLEEQGCVDIGLETMPENPTNMGMYLKAGLRPEGLVLTFSKKLDPEALEEGSEGRVSIERLSESSVQDALKKQMKRLSGSLRPGLDYTKEVELAQQFSLGDTLVATFKDQVVGFCLVHTVLRRLNMSGSAVRVLAVDPGARDEVLESLVAAAELMAADAKTPEISIPIPAQCRRALDLAFSRGYFITQSLVRLMWMGSSGVSDKSYNLCSWSG